MIKPVSLGLYSYSTSCRSPYPQELGAALSPIVVIPLETLVRGRIKHSLPCEP